MFRFAAAPPDPACGVVDEAALSPAVEDAEADFLAPLVAGDLGRSERMKVKVWNREKVANGTRVRGMGFCNV